MGLSKILVLFAVATTASAAGPASFLTIGDWGGAALDNPASKAAVLAVAEQMKTCVGQHDPQFVVGLGDNFYWCGIQNTSDYQIKVDWAEPYGNAGLINIPWYHVLGNHEYGYNVQAQLDLGKLYKTWVLDDRYYYRRVPVGPTFISMVFLDSSPCVSEYRSSDRAGWDPCGSEYPTCSIKNPSDPHDHFEGPCEFNKNILSQDCGAQLAWLEKVMAAIPKDDWVIINAHHPGDEMDVEDLLSVIQKHGFDLYLNGHAHTLTHYAIDGNSAYITSGAGSQVPTQDQIPTTPGKNRTYRKVAGLPLEPYNGHQYHTMWNDKVAGFTLHTFSADYETLTNTFISYTGEVLHTFDVKKGVPPSPAPVPPPPPPAPPGSTCCYSKSDSCTPGQVCCKSDCKDARSCSYTKTGCGGRYGQKHHCEWNGNYCVVEGPPQKKAMEE